jgi:hypothetical protein
MAPSDYPYRVERMGPHGEVGHVLVYADHLGLARAAFKAAVQQWPKERFRLRQRALIIEEHRPKLSFTRGISGVSFVSGTGTKIRWRP